MKQKLVILYILLGLALLAGTVYLLSAGQDQQKPVNWEEHYNNNSRDPFGTYVVFELLKDYTSRKDLRVLDKPFHKEVSNSPADSGNYVFIGNALFLGKSDMDSLLLFAEAGNTVFISSRNFPEALMDTLFPGHCSEWDGHYGYKDSVISMNFQHPDLASDSGFTYKIPYMGAYAPVVYNWQGLNGRYFCDSVSLITDLGYIVQKDSSRYVNYMVFPYGKGKFLLHTTPIAFTNYYLKNAEGRDYAERAFSHLNEGRIYWDQFSRVPYYDEHSKLSPSPLKLILSHPSLRMAWYLMLLLIILYILFFAKRKQRVIPVLERKANNSLEFIRTIGMLYFQQNNHRNVMRLKLKLFLSYIRQRYHIPTNVVNEELIRKVSLKSDIAYEEVDSIFREINVINRYDLQMTADDLIRLHNSLDFFYKNCK